MGKFVVSQAKTGIKFNLKASNGQIIATSQVYKSLKSCLAGVQSVITNSAVATVEDQTAEGFKAEKCPKFEVYTDKAGETRFRLKAKNGQIIATSEGYKTLASAKKGIASVKKNSADAPVDDLTDKPEA